MRSYLPGEQFAEGNESEEDDGGNDEDMASVQA